MTIVANKSTGQFYWFSNFEVSYEVIQILLEHQELIGTLANRSVKLYCFDERINPEEIANFNHVINPNELTN